MYKKEIIIIFCLFIYISMILLIPIVNSYGEEWFNLDWEYRKMHSINGSIGSGYNYSIPITVYYDEIPNVLYNIDVENAWCWFSKPVTMEYNNVLYVCWINKDGDVGILSLNYTTNEIDTYELHNSLHVDDHSIPSVAILQNGSLFCGYSTHNLDNLVRYRISENPEDISEWNTEQTFSTGTATTYVQPILLDSTFYVFYRTFDGVNVGWSYRKSTDSCNSFSSEYIMYYNQSSGSPSPYTIPVKNGENRIDFCVTETSGGNSETDGVRHFYMESGSFYESDGTLICSEGSLPFTLNDMTTVYDSSVTGYDAWIQDISINPIDDEPVIVFTEFENVDTTHNYEYAYWSGTEWIIEHIINGGSYIDGTAQKHYSGGIAIDRNNASIVYASVGSGSDFDIYKLVTDDNGENWNDELISDTTVKSLRPQSVYNYTVSNFIWFYGTYDFYDDYDCYISVYSEIYTGGNMVSCEGNCRTDFGDIRFTDDDGETELNYWIQEKYDGDYAVFWVKVSDNLDSDVNIFMYYGNSEATYLDDYTDLEHGENTFLIFDNFDSGVLDTEKWNLIQGNVGWYGNEFMVLTDTIGTRGLIESYDTVSLGTYYCVSAQYGDILGGQCHFLALRTSGNWNNRALDLETYTDYPSIFFTYNSGSSTTTNPCYFSSPTSYNIYVGTWESGESTVYVNNTLIAQHNTNIPITDEVLVLYEGNIHSGSSLGIDYIFARNWINPEPISGLWSIEQTYVPLPTPTPTPTLTPTPTGTSTPTPEGEITDSMIIAIVALLFAFMAFTLVIRNKKENK